MIFVRSKHFFRGGCIQCVQLRAINRRARRYVQSGQLRCTISCCIAQYRNVNLYRD